MTDRVINPSAREHPANMRTATATTWEEEDYIVRLASGDVRAMTVEQLDEAFHDGRVGAGTPIVAPGGSAWSTLGALASLAPDDEPASIVPVVVTEPAAAPDDAELARVVPPASRLLTVAIVAFVFAALGTVALVTLRSRTAQASAGSAPARVEPAPRAVPVPPPPAPVVTTPPPPTATATASATGTQNATGSDDRKRRPRTRRK
jgi:hypothetical protein